MKIIYAQQDLSTLQGQSIFLAGPTPRSKNVKSWRPDAIDLLKQQGFNGTVLVPEMENGWTTDFAYGDQINWETKALERATIILFWIPRELPDMPAFTTNIEFGMWLERDASKLTVGWPDTACKVNYLKYKADEIFLAVYPTLEELITHTLFKIKLFNPYTKPVCRGAWALGNNCKTCEKCIATRPKEL